MKTVYKYKLPIMGEQTIPIHDWHEVLTLKLQNGIPCIWVLVDTDKPIKDTKFYYFGTGHEITKGNLRYIDSIIIYNDELVYHLFEEKR